MTDLAIMITSEFGGILYQGECLEFEYESISGGYKGHFKLKTQMKFEQVGILSVINFTNINSTTFIIYEIRLKGWQSGGIYVYEFYSAKML
jgi:hypothetical protein